MKKVEKRDPPKSGNFEFKSHFKHSSYLCQCHICALTIFYLWTVNVICPKWLVKWRKLRKGTPPKVGILNSNRIFKQSSYLCQCHICELTIFYLWTVNVIFPKWLVKWRKLRKGTPPKVGMNSNHFKLIICQCHICALTIFYLWTVNVISPKWLVKWRKLRKGTPPKVGILNSNHIFKQSSYLCQCHICALTIFYLWTVNVISPKWLVKWRKLRKGTPPKVGILNSNHILNIHHIYANVIFVH